MRWLQTSVSLTKSRLHQRFASCGNVIGARVLNTRLRPCRRRTGRFSSSYSRSSFSWFMIMPPRASMISSCQIPNRRRSAQSCEGVNESCHHRQVDADERSTLRREPVRHSLMSKLCRTLLTDLRRAAGFRSNIVEHHVSQHLQLASLRHIHAAIGRFQLWNVALPTPSLLHTYS